MIPIGKENGIVLVEPQKWWLCCYISKKGIEAPIQIVDGEKRIYYSTHKYTMVESASLSYLFEEIDKTLREYEALLQSGSRDITMRSNIKERWIYNKARIRNHKDVNANARLTELQALFRAMDNAWRNPDSA